MKKTTPSNSPRFSIVIPTRNRARTLGATLQSCLDQNFSNYEIVVCDNCSTPETQAVVEQFVSDKIVYHRAKKPLSMSANWNLAYSLAKGEFVTFLGDDDALMPFALHQLDAVLSKTKVKAVRWDAVIYGWPNIALAEHANYFQVPLSRRYEFREGRQTISAVLNAKISGEMLPRVYHGLVASEVLDRVRQKTGRVFGSYHCDTYTSFAVAYELDRYISLDTPMTVMGFSSASNNIAFSLMRRKSAIGQNYRAEHAGSAMSKLIPDLASHYVVLPESFLAAKADLFPKDDTLVLDRRVMVGQLLKRMPIDTIDEWPAAVAEIRRSVSDDPELLAWFEKRLTATRPKTSPRDSFPRHRGFRGGQLYLNVKKRGITNVAQAAKFAAQILRVGGRDLVVEREGVGSRLMRKLKVAKFLLLKAGRAP